MSALKVLFIGGSGIISSACSRLAVERGIDLYVLNRGRRTRAAAAGRGATCCAATSGDPASVADALGDRDVRRRRRLGRLHARSTSGPTSTCSAGGPASTSSSAPPRPTRPRRRGCRSPSRPRCATRSGSTRATRSPARTCWSRAYREEGFPVDDRAARRTPTTRRSVPLRRRLDRASTGCARASRSSSTATAPRCGR